MIYLRQVQRGVDFIEGRLHSELALTEVSEAAGLSHWHFQRTFKALTGQTLGSYVRQRQLAEAAAALLGTDRAILDIALSAGFEAQASFSRAFKRAYGVPPATYRRGGQLGPVLRRVQLDRSYLEHLAQRRPPEPEIVDWQARSVVGLRTDYSGSESDKNNVASKIPPLWEAFLARLHEVPNPVPGLCYGRIEQTEGALAYDAAIGCAPGPIPDGMHRAEIPAATWALFEHRGPVDLLDHTVSYVYGAWLAQTDWRHTWGPDLEIYGHDYLPDSPESVIRYGIPVRR